MMKRLAMLGLGAVLGAALGALGLLTGQRSGFLSLPTSPGDPWENAPDAGRAVSPTALPVASGAADGTDSAGNTGNSHDSGTAGGPDTADVRSAPEAPMGAVSTAVPADEPSAPHASSSDASAPHTGQAADPVRYLTVGEVAELLGTTTSALSKTPGLPEPDAVVGRTRGWLETTITRVLEDRAQA